MTDLENLVRGAISKICDIDLARVQLDATLGELGVDSLAAAEVLVEIEITLGRELPVDVLRRLDEADTVGAIAAQLESVIRTAPSRPAS
jgi:acyl carrier protein